MQNLNNTANNTMQTKQPFYKTVNVKETCKIAEITDAFGQLRYKVEMTSFDIVDDGRYELSYQVQVVNYFYGPEPLIIFEAPNVDEPPIKDIKVATAIYEQCVKNYTALVKAETRDFQDIDIYKTKIDYKEICPECCATCKWSLSARKIFAGGACFDSKMYCVSPKNRVEFNIDVKDNLLDRGNRATFDEEFGHTLMPEDNATFNVMPKVIPFGVCKNYEKSSRLD